MVRATEGLLYKATSSIAELKKFYKSATLSQYDGKYTLGELVHIQGK